MAGKGQRWWDTSHLKPKAQKNHEAIFGKKEMWWEKRDKKLNETKSK